MSRCPINKTMEIRDANSKNCGSGVTRIRPIPFLSDHASGSLGSNSASLSTGVNCTVLVTERALYSYCCVGSPTFANSRPSSSSSSEEEHDSSSGAALQALEERLPALMASRMRCSVSAAPTSPSSSSKIPMSDSALRSALSLLSFLNKPFHTPRSAEFPSWPSLPVFFLGLRRFMSYKPSLSCSYPIQILVSPRRPACIRPREYDFVFSTGGSAEERICLRSWRSMVLACHGPQYERCLSSVVAGPARPSLRIPATPGRCQRPCSQG